MKINHVLIFFRCFSNATNPSSRSENCTNQPTTVPIRVTLISTVLVTVCLTGSLALIVMESWLPKAMKRLSYTLVHDRNKRNTVIFITFSFMYLATGIAVVSHKSVAFGLALFWYNNITQSQPKVNPKSSWTKPKVSQDYRYYIYFPDRSKPHVRRLECQRRMYRRKQWWKGIIHHQQNFFWWLQ